MSRNIHGRPRRTQRAGVVVLGAAAVLTSAGPATGATTGVIISLDPNEIILSAFPEENYGAMDPMADPNTPPTLTLVDVQYSGTITVNLPGELDSTAVEADLEFDDDSDGTPDKVYSSSLPPADPLHLTISGQGTGSIQVTLPADDATGVDTAVLYLAPLGSTLSPKYTYIDPVFYDLNFDAGAPAAVTVDPVLIAISQEPCELSSAGRCAFPTPVEPGSTLAVDLPAGSSLGELGIANLTGVQVGLQRLDANGAPVGAAVALPASVGGSGSSANFTIPAGTTPGSYGLVFAQAAPSGSISIVFVELTIVAAPVAAPATAVNAGLRSNTGVEVVETGSTGTVPVAIGAGLLLLAGAGGIAVARTRRRPAVEGGTCES